MNFRESLSNANRKEYDKFVKNLSEASQKEKDELLVQAHFYIKELTRLLSIVVDKSIAKNDKNLNKEIQEIENTISLGIPGWIKYTRRNKKTKA